MTSTLRIRATDAQGKVFAELRARESSVVTISDMQAATGLSRDTVSGALARLAKGKLPVVRITSGVYSYKPNSVSVNTLFERIAVTKTGSVVLQDEDGNVFVAKPVQ